MDTAIHMVRNKLIIVIYHYIHVDTVSTYRQTILGNRCQMGCHNEVSMVH